MKALFINYTPFPDSATAAAAAAVGEIALPPPPPCPCIVSFYSAYVNAAENELTFVMGKSKRPLLRHGKSADASGHGKGTLRSASSTAMDRSLPPVCCPFQSSWTVGRLRSSLTGRAGSGRKLVRLLSCSRRVAILHLSSRHVVQSSPTLHGARYGALHLSTLTASFTETSSPVGDEVAWRRVRSSTCIICPLLSTDRCSAGNLLINHLGELKISDFGISRDMTVPSISAQQHRAALDAARPATTGSSDTSASAASGIDDDDHLGGVADLADTFVGTQQYMSPECLSGKPYSYSADVWSAGLCVLAVALGRYPLDPTAGYWLLLEQVRGG
jgi:hypothetical protein